MSYFGSHFRVTETGYFAAFFGGGETEEPEVPASSARALDFGAPTAATVTFTASAATT